MMTWIESHQELGRHPKTRKAARLLGISAPTMVGHLHYLWWWAMDFAQNGDLAETDAADICEGAMWEGDPVLFLGTLADVGFLDREGDAYHLHDWQEYAGKLIERRRIDAERKRSERTPSIKDGVQRMSAGRRTPSGVTVPDPTVPDPTGLDGKEPWVLPQPVVAVENGAAGAAHPAALELKPKRVTARKLEPVLTDDERAKLHAEFDGVFGVRGVDDWITLALAHDAARKYRDRQSWYVYVRVTWLQREAKKLETQHGAIRNGTRGGAASASAGRNLAGAGVGAAQSVDPGARDPRELAKLRAEGRL